MHLTGREQIITAVLDEFTVSDLRGTGEGWHVLVTASQLAESDPVTGMYVPEGKTLVRGTLWLNEPVLIDADAVSPEPDVLNGPNGIDTRGGMVIIRANKGAGLGTYTFGPTTLQLVVPASAYARTYQTDVTISIVAGP